MKAAGREIDTLSSESIARLPKYAEPSNVEAVSYARDLRAVGQALEVRQVATLDIVAVTDTYVIRGRIQNQNDADFPNENPLGQALRKIWTALTGDSRSRSPCETINLRFTLEDVKRFEEMGRTKRRSSKAIPNPNGLSQVLRSAGAYLDAKEQSALIGISVAERWVTIRFQTADGHPEEAKHDVQFLYDYWVKMYLRRGNRSIFSQPSDPTLLLLQELAKKRLP